jgi:glycine cleavage system H lipoate-binding protein
MTGHELSTMYSAKVAEYLIAVAYLLLFLPFWRWINAAPAAARTATAADPGWLGWFRVPEHVYLHPGHAWARLGRGGDLVTVGMDDFAQKLVGAVSAVRLPAVGAQLAQGERAVKLTAGSRSVDLLSPVDGTVVAVNDRLAASPGTLGEDPYGEGWLLKLRSPRVAANLKQLLSGPLAQRFVEESWAGLRALMAPAVGLASEDGGAPVEGMARSLDPDHWDELARRFLRSETKMTGVDGPEPDPGATAEPQGSAHGG